MSIDPELPQSTDPHPPVEAVTPPSVDIRLRPLRAEDLGILHRLVTEPDLIGYDWNGFKDAAAVTRRFAENGYLSDELSALIAEVDGETAGVLQHRQGQYSGRAHYQEIGIVLLPEFRGRGIGWRAQALLCDYLFQHWPIQRIQAGTQPENVAEQKALVKAGFLFEGVVRAAEFRAGQWRDGLLYSRLRDDPAPNL